MKGARLSSESWVFQEATPAAGSRPAQATDSMKTQRSTPAAAKRPSRQPKPADVAGKGTPKTAGKPANTEVPADTPPRVRINLSTIGAVRMELARLYREGKAGQRDIGDVSRLANVLALMGRLIEGSDLEKRLEELEQRAAEENTGRGTWPRRH